MAADNPAPFKPIETVSVADVFRFLASAFGQGQSLHLNLTLMSKLGDDMPSVLLLQQLVYWTPRCHDPELWIYKTYEQWQEELRLSKFLVNQAADSLEQIGILERSKHYSKSAGKVLLHYRLRQSELIRWFSSTGTAESKISLRQESESKISLTEVKNLTDRSEKFDFGPTAYKEADNYSNQIQQTITNLPSSPENTNLQTQETPVPEIQETLPQSPLPGAGDTEKTYDLQDGTSVLEFVKNAYRQSRGAKITNADLKRFAERIMEAEQSASPEEFRTGLWKFLETSSDWLRENKWPIMAYLKSPSGYTPASQRTSRVVSPLDSPAPKVSHSSYLQYVDRWNTVIPEVPCVTLQKFEIKLVEDALRKGEFEAVFEDVLAKCRQILDAHPEMTGEFTFPSLFVGFTPKWQRIYMGTFNWAMKAKSQKSAIDQAIEDAERLQREQEEAMA